MQAAAVLPTARRWPAWGKFLVGLLGVLAALVLVVVFFPWDVLREPLNRYVTERTGRHFAITRKLDVKLGRTTRVLADGIEFANPKWAKDPYLVRAEGAEVQVSLLPLLRRRIELPLVVFHRPELGLQMEADGRRSWALGKDTSDPANVPLIGALVIDEGTLHFVAPHHGADIRAKFALGGAGPVKSDRQRAASAAVATASGSKTAEPQATASTSPGSPLPLTFSAQGTWKREPFEARGRTGNVLRLNSPLVQPFPAEFTATAGRTTLTARGEVSSLSTLEGARAQVQLQGQNLADLYHLIGMVMPETPRYSADFRLAKVGDVWDIAGIDAKLGKSDLSGHLKFDQGHSVPLLTGEVTSKVLDFDDLAPMVGLPEQPQSAAAVLQVAGAQPVKASAKRAPAGKVLPTATLDVHRLRVMNADVRYTAARIAHPRQLPLDNARLHIVLKDAVLRLAPMELGVAGGKVSGRMVIDARRDTASSELDVGLRGLQLNRLFPTMKLTQASFGSMHGDIQLKGGGNSVAQMLGSSSGVVELAMGRGTISNLLMEFVGIDGGEIIKFLLSGDQNVQLRCFGAAFDVNRGNASSRILVLDTADTVVHGQGRFNFANESVDLYFRPYPKDTSILSLRSPLKVTGSFSGVKAGPEMGALAGRAGLALALGAINPVLALAATIETGPGKDTNCAAVLREATGPLMASRLAGATPAAAAASAAVMGNASQRKGLLERLRLRVPVPRPDADYPLDPPAQPSR